MSEPNSKVSIGANGAVAFSNSAPLSIIAGPCAMESRDHAFDMAGALKEICERLGIGFVYKSSYDKANRTSLSSKRGVGLDKAMAIFSDIKTELNVPVLSDVHERERSIPS